MFPKELAEAEKPFVELLLAEIDAAAKAGLLHPPNRNGMRGSSPNWFASVFHYYAYAPRETDAKERLWQFCLAALGGTPTTKPNRGMSCRTRNRRNCPAAEAGGGRRPGTTSGPCNGATWRSATPPPAPWTARSSIRWADFPAACAPVRTTATFSWVDPRDLPNTDRPDEAAVTGEVYFFPAGHVLIYPEPTTALELNPAFALRQCMDAIVRAGQRLQISE